jgi:hypothetical protein
MYALEYQREGVAVLEPYSSSLAALGRLRALERDVSCGNFRLADIGGRIVMDQATMERALGHPSHWH